MRVQLADSLVVERLGSELLVCSSDDVQVVRVVGEAAVVLSSVLDGGVLDVIDGPVLVGLVESGVLVGVGDRSGLTRRRVLAVGAGAAAIGIIGVAMPSVAAAASLAPVAYVSGLSIAETGISTYGIVDLGTWNPNSPLTVVSYLWQGAYSLTDPDPWFDMGTDSTQFKIGASYFRLVVEMSAPGYSNGFGTSNVMEIGVLL